MESAFWSKSWSCCCP